ncbi:response regulator transcription factor [Actinomyces culturomici]|uniref:response regulator n=1 Tax=Actinomyces culturomici TaxID=1926276 RepID=UPI000E202B5F|nr:response regulator [Actinomyces culturomici]
MSENTARVLVFSADVDKRRAVIDGVGVRASKDSPKIEWSEAATPFGAKELVESTDFDLLVLDAETTKEGGMSLAQELKNTIGDVPPIVFLTARQQDDWLATWAGGAAAIPDPLDPVVLQETVAAVLAGDLR